MRKAIDDRRTYETVTTDDLLVMTDGIVLALDGKGTSDPKRLTSLLLTGIAT